MYSYRFFNTLSNQWYSSCETSKLL